MNQQLQTNRYLTSDLGLAAALTALGHRVTELDRSNPSRVEFVFARTGSLTRDVDGYWSNRLSVAPQDYFNAIKSLKNRIHSR